MIWFMSPSSLVKVTLQNANGELPCYHWPLCVAIVGYGRAADIFEPVEVMGKCINSLGHLDYALDLSGCPERNLHLLLPPWILG